jgi:hypothetical protein
MRDRESLKIQMHKVRVEGGKESREQDEKSRSGGGGGDEGERRIVGVAWNKSHRIVDNLCTNV